MKRRRGVFGGRDQVMGPGPETQSFAQLVVLHFEELTASLKRCPDTKPEFFRRL